MSRSGPDHHGMPCPNCGKVMDCSTSIGGERHGQTNQPVQPVEGDFSICLYCATFLTYYKDDEGKLYLARIPDDQLPPAALLILEDFRDHLRAQGGFSE